jgi:NAD(P)-dependent dehydrogenase (short-subunit alcohol dehydrogenase family)
MLKRRAKERESMGSDRVDWKDKVIVVTGGAVGIGAATAQLFADHGAKIVIMDMNEVAPDRRAKIEASGSAALYHRGDVSSPSDVEKMSSAALGKFGRIDVLVNNAGIMRRHEDPFAWTLEEIRLILDVNLYSIFIATHAIAPIIANGGGGAIVNISSFGGIWPVPNSPVYAATKAGILGLTRSMAPKLSERGVRVNAVLPNFVDTPLTADSPHRRVMPMLDPIDIARGVLRVAGDPTLQGQFFAVQLDEGRRVISRVSDAPSFTPLGD